LIVEGYPALDARPGCVTVYATKVTTRLLEAGKRQAQENG